MNEHLPIERTTPVEYQSKSWVGKIWNHWLNPFGNWIEPLPYPAGRAQEAKESIWPPGVYWTILRNPLHNFMTHWIGITPIGPRYAWISPTAVGWTRTQESDSNWAWWEKPTRISLPFYNHLGESWQFYIGWTLRGNFGVALRKVTRNTLKLFAYAKVNRWAIVPMAKILLLTRLDDAGKVSSISLSICGNVHISYERPVPMELIQVRYRPVYIAMYRPSLTTDNNTTIRGPRIYFGKSKMVL